MSRDDAERLGDIARAIDTIRRNLTAPEAMADLKRDAILYNLVIIGEAVKLLSDETKARRADIPWRQIAGLRDLIAHQYFRIDMAEINKIVERDLGPLSDAVAALRKPTSRQA